jgi:cell division protein FtsW
MGFVGALILISLFSALFFRVVQISKRLRDPFVKVLATVLGAEIVLQAFLNMGAMIGIIPLTGTPLPFISYGGTHLVVELISIGLILNISRLKT